MKTKIRLGYLVLAVLALSLVACGNSQKKKEKTQQKTMTAQPQDSVVVIETETLVVEVDSLAADTTAAKK